MKILFLMLLGLLWGCSEKKPSKVVVVEDPSVEKATMQQALDSFWLGNSPILITEIAPFNASYEDQEGNDPGWVELYNPGAEAVNLQGYALTDRFDQRRRWVFGQVVVPPQSYITVFMSRQNQPNLVPAPEDISLLSEFAYAWADGDGSPAGNSEVWHNYFANDVKGVKDGRRMLAATLVVGDNSDTELSWTASKVVMNFLGWNDKQTVDFGTRSTLQITGYIQKNKSLGIRLAQVDVEEWEGWITYLNGTGDSNEVYNIALPKTGFPDLSALWAMTVEAPAGQDTISFVFKDARAVATATYPQASFKLDKNGSYLWLTDAEGMVRDTVTYPALGVDESWARNATGQWGFAVSTPGTANEVVYAERGAPVKISVPSGFYGEAFTVALSGDNVHYTLDGAEPDAKSPVYTEPLLISKNTVLRARSIPPQGKPGAVQTYSYFIGENTSLPVVSLVVDPHAMFDPDTGIYSKGPNAESKQPYFGANFWKDIELPATVSLFEPGGKKGFDMPAGLKIFGNWSKSFDKKSLSLHFREKYGAASLKYTVFPGHGHLKEFKSLVLRNGGNNTSKDYIRDPLASSLTAGLQVDYQKYRPAILFINGEYWGIYGIREKTNSNFIPTNYGYDKSVVNMLIAGGGVKRGSATGWREFMDWLETADMSDPASMERVRATIDLDNFMDYTATEIFANNTDWPANNMKFWHALHPHQRWRWIMYDMDFGFNGNAADGASAAADFNIYQFMTATNGPDWPNGPRHTLLFRKLFAAPEFAADFSNRMAVLLAWQFAPARINARIDAMMGELEGHTQRDQQRWKFKASTFTSEVQKMRDFANERGAYVREYTRQQFGLGADVAALVQSVGGGFIQVNGLTLPLSEFYGTWFAGQALRLRAVAPAGKTFVGWSDGKTAAERLWVPVADGAIVANFN